MQGYQTALLAAWAYADDRKNWSHADREAWHEAILTLKQKVNDSPTDAICCEETIAPLKQISLEIAEYLKKDEKDPTISADVSLFHSPYSHIPARRMSSKCRQYIGLILFCLLSWAAAAAPYEGTRMGDMIFSLEGLLLNSAVREPSSRVLIGRLRRALTRDESHPAPLSPREIWSSFVQWRMAIPISIDPTPSDKTPNIETISTKELGVDIDTVEIGKPSYQDYADSKVPVLLTRVPPLKQNLHPDQSHPRQFSQRHLSRFPEHRPSPPVSAPRMSALASQIQQSPIQRRSELGRTL
jgi:hypothetical protein